MALSAGSEEVGLGRLGCGVAVVGLEVADAHRVLVVSVAALGRYRGDGGEGGDTSRAAATSGHLRRWRPLRGDGVTTRTR